MARSEIDKMLEWKERRGEPRLTFILSNDLSQIGQLWREKGEAAAEFADFIPMRIVTIIEVFVREAIRELVDSGAPYLDRAEALSKGAKLDFALLSGLQGRTLSVGDLVAHTISINEPGRILAYMEVLVPGFVDKLKASHERWTEDQEDWPLAPIISDYDEMFRQLARIFHVRHILTHELPRDPAFDPAEIPDFVAAGTEFLAATDWVLVHELKGAVPRTQSTMNVQAGEHMSNLEAELEVLLATTMARGDVNKDLLERSQVAWEAYAAAEADCHASLVWRAGRCIR